MKHIVRHCPVLHGASSKIRDKQEVLITTNIIDETYLE